MSGGRNVDPDRAFTDVIERLMLRVATLEAAGAAGAPVLFFPSTTIRDAYTGPRTLGQRCVVGSATVYGVTTDVEYVWDGSAWKVWNLPASGAALAMAVTLGATTTAPTVGTGGYTTGWFSIRGRLVYGGAKTVWGTTNGTAGTGRYEWATPFTFAIPAAPGSNNDFASLGGGYAYIGGLPYSGETRVYPTAATKLTLMCSTYGDTGSTINPGSANRDYYLSMHGVPLAAASA